MSKVFQIYNRSSFSKSVPITSSILQKYTSQSVTRKSSSKEPWILSPAWQPRNAASKTNNQEQEDKQQTEGFTLPHLSAQWKHSRSGGKIKKRNGKKAQRIAFHRRVFSSPLLHPPSPSQNNKATRKYRPDAMIAKFILSPRTSKKQNLIYI